MVTPIVQQKSHSSGYSVTMAPHDMEVLDDNKHDGAEEIEKMEDDTANMKPTSETFTPEDERRLIRKLDFWYATTFILVISTRLPRSMAHSSVKDYSSYDGDVHAAELRQGCHECRNTIQLQCGLEAHHNCRSFTGRDSNHE